MSIGNKVVHCLISRASYEALATKSNDTLYFVADSSQITLYKGETVVGSGGFKVLAQEPSTASGMLEGTLYLAPSGKFYYNSGGTLATALDLVKSADLPAKNASGNDSKVATVAAIYAAIGNEISAAMSGTYRNHILEPVQDVTALKAVTGMQDKDVILVEDLNAIFSYDAQSEAADNSSSTAADAVPTVVKPTSVTTGAGRWIRTQSQLVYDSNDFTWTASAGLTLNSTRVSGILGSAEATAEGKVAAHNSAADAHSTLFGGKLDKPAAAASDGQYLAWDATSGKPVWTDLSVPAGVTVVSTLPTVTSADNGKVYYNRADGQVYEVASGALVAKVYSKAAVDALLLAKASLDDVKWNVTE